MIGQLPSAAVDISIPDDNFEGAPEFQPRRTPGPHLPPNTDVSALDLFELYFDDTVITRLVESTVAYAEENKERKKSMYRRLKLRELNKEEMMRFIAVLLLLGITGVRSYRKAWSMKNAQFIIRLNELMSRNRFEAIAAFFHIVTPEEEGRSIGNPLRKILPLHEHMKQRCFQLYQPLQQVSVDERMVKSKARTKFRQYLRDKPIKWGFKYWVMSDPTGYTCDFNLYCGAAQSVRSENGLGYDVVTSLISPLHDQGYQLYCDNFYSGPALFLHLLEHGITATGTLRINRRGVPSVVGQVQSLLKAKDTPRGKGYYIREKDSPIVYCCWNDNQCVCSMSTCFPGHSVNTISRKGKNPVTGLHEVCQIKVPMIIENYNKYMGGVDKSDQFLRYHSSLRRTTRYWKTLFYHMLDVAVTNAFILYNWVAMEQGSKAISENRFRDALILQLIKKYRVSPSPVTDPQSSIPLPLTLPPSECRMRHGSTIGTQQARCQYCQKSGTESWTKRRCLDCPFVPALCQTAARDCHTAWHLPGFDIARCSWFSQMSRVGNRPVTLQTNKRAGRPIGAVNKRRRRGNYRKS